jgi:hypothetical protein
MRYEHQTAKLTRKLTGMPHTQALQMARGGDTERDRPVPDALTADQRAFEARLAFALIEAFPEHLQPHGYPWGIASVRADTDGLDIHPDPAATAYLLGALVPCHDRQYGGVQGASGTRVTISDGWWILHDLQTAAKVRVAAPASADPRRGRNEASPRSRRYITAARLTREERRDLGHIERIARSKPDGWLAHRNILGSRLLRRPGLVQLLAQAHGNANIYSHASMDVVLEWCCGDTSDQFSRACHNAGLTADLAGEPLPGTTINRRSDFATTV